MIDYRSSASGVNKNRFWMFWMNPFEDSHGRRGRHLLQIFRQERQAALPPEAVRTVEGLLLRERCGVEGRIDLLHPLETRFARGDREDVVLLSRLNEEGTRRDQAGNVVHFGIVENARDVVVDAVRDGHD